MLIRFLFPTNPNGVFISVILLVVRIVFGILMMNHGIDKWANYQELSTVFPDPLGIGSPLSLGLAIFGELACSMAFMRMRSPKSAPPVRLREGSMLMMASFKVSS